MARPSTLEPLAASIQRLGVMLAAGVAPNSAWGYLAEEAPVEIFDAVHHVSGATDRGETIQAALAAAAARPGVRDRESWKALAAAWMVASESGAPLAATLADFATTIRSIAHTQRELRTALAGPAATAKLVMVLPVIGVLFAVALGFDVIITLFTTIPGLVCLGGGGLLMVAARVWSMRLIRNASPHDLTPGIALDLMAIAVSGGSTTDRARQLVASAAEYCQLTDLVSVGSLKSAGFVESTGPVKSTGFVKSTASVERTGSVESAVAVESVLRLSQRAGVPAGILLRSEAKECRRRAESDAQRKAATLSVTLMLPLGLCVLPAFMLLGVAPLVIAVVAQTVAPL